MIRFVGYLWAAPATVIGLFGAAIAAPFGATVRVRDGVFEVAGGWAAGRLSAATHILAITFGHVVLGIDHDTLDRERSHEHAHVRQYERWGVLFFPLYVLSSAAQWMRGRPAYADNLFERDARAVAARASGADRTTA